MFNFCWHKFGMWGELIQGYSIWQFRQYRKCKMCGSVRVRKVRNGTSVDVGKANNSISNNV